MWIYFYSLTFLKVLMLFLKSSECLSDSFSKVPIGFGSGADSLNKDLQTFQKRCNRIEDVKLTLQEWSEIILVSFTRSSSSSTPSSNEEIPHHEELKNPMTLTFTVNKTTYDLPLHLHRESYKETLKITLHANETFSRSVPKNCHYFGSTWKSRRTLPISAFINLCSKTSGLILLGGETFIIKSLDFEICQQQNESSRSHIAFKIPTATDEKPTNLDSVCGNGLWAWKRFQGSNAHRAEFLRNLKIGKSKNQNNKSSHCLVIKLGLALDHSLISKLNASVEDVKQQMLLLSNILNQLLKELHKNIQIELVHLDLWKDVDLFPTSLGPRWTLSSLVENARLFADADGLTFHYLHLLSGQSMDGPHYGASIPDSICTDRAVGFSYVENSDDIVSMASGIMHMLGHVIGLEHDGSDGGNSKSKKCPDHRGFAMSPKRLHYFPNMQTSSPSSLSSPNRSGDRMNKNKRNNNGSRSHDSHHHRHRHHHFHLGWSSCSQHEFGLNLKSRFLGCLRGQCVQHHHHHHNREQSDDAPSKGNSRLADRNNRSDGYIATAAEDNNDGSDDDDDDDTSLPGGGNGFKKNFFAKCGNGILERGEECDCGSLEDCRASDPCCDHRTCLLKPWATCRKGACCTNCTLSATNHMCREMKSLCDVPEFCTGNSEECPEDSLVLDGQPCMQSDGGDYEIAMETSNATERGLCYEGRCRSYDQQCAAIWGSNSSKASDGCFSTFNQIGAISGHCGSSPTSLSSSPSTLSSSLPLTSLEAEEMSSGLMPSSSSSSSSSSSPSLSPSTEFMKCSQRDAKCGLLHCKGGPQKPLVGDTVSVLFETTITSFGKSVQCKVLSNPNNPEYHLVEDGSPCSKDSMCISNKCTPIAEVVSHRCPRGENNLTCSGNGVCTDKLECFCDRQFSGDDCSSPVDKTEVPLTPADEFSETLNVGEDFQYYNDSSTFNKTYGADKVTLDSIRNAANALWLLGAMSCVIVGASAILILCLICYRRKTPKLTKKQQICQLRNQSLMCKSVCETSSRVNRIISFGSLPSYRADKLRKAMKGSNHSETESEKSSKRNSGEVSIKIGKEAKATYLPLPDPPDKGILKRPESKGQRRNRAAAQEEAAANTGSDVSSIPGDSAVCGSGIPKKERVNDAKKVRNRIDVPSESSSTNQNANSSRDEGKSVRNSLATMPDILPKVSEHIKPMEVKCAVSETSKRDNSNVISQNMSTESDLKNETRSMDCEKLSKRSKAGRNVVEECSFVDGTGTMSSFLSTSDLEASPRPIAPAPSLCSEYSPQSSTTSKNAPVSFSTQPLVIPKAEQQNNLKSCANDEASRSSSSSPNSSCSTFTSSLSEALAHDPSQISEFNKKRDASLLPSRRSADRATKYSTKEATKQTNPAGVSSCTRGESSAFLSSRTAQSCAHNQRDEMLTSLQLRNCWDTHDQSFNKSINCSSPQRLEKLSNRSRNTNADVFKPDPKGAYTKAPGSPGAPDDDDDG